MNEDFFRYKSRFITVALLLGYAFLHNELTRPFVETPFENMIDFSIRFPYAQRILVPLLAYPFTFLSIPPGYCFFLAECIFASLLYFGVYHLLRYEFNPREAQLLSWLFILLLPLVMIINYRFTIGETASFFYPSDTPAIFFTALGLLWCLRAQWLYFVPWVFLATFNRESSILLVLLVPILYWQHLRDVLKPVLFSFLAYIAARIIILSSLRGTPGKLIEWYAFYSTHTHLELNLEWLLTDLNLLLFCFCFAGLPLFWFAFYDYIPKTYRPLRYLTLFYFIGLLLVGNFVEPRIFGEIMVLLYLPVCAALRDWISGLSLVDNENKNNYIYYLNRYFILSCFAFVILFRASLNQLLLWFIRSFT